METMFDYMSMYARHILSWRKTLCGYNRCLDTAYDRVFLHAALRLFSALPLEPIADAMEGAGIGWQCEW